jgi:hypothetical protein
MSDQTDRPDDVLDRERQMEEQEREGRERETDERDPAERADEAKPAPPGQVEQPRG